MHPIMTAYISGKSLKEVLSAYRNSKNWLEKMLYERIEVKHKKPSDEWLEQADLALTRGHPDSDLMLLYIAEYIELCAIWGDINRIRAIYQTSLSIDTHLCHPLLQDRYKLATGYYLRMEGRKAEVDEFYIEMLPKMFPLESQKKASFGNIAMILSWSGKLEEVEKKYFNLTMAEPTNSLFAYSSYLMMNGYLTVNWKQLESAWAVYKKQYLLNSQDALKYYEDALKLLRLDFHFDQYQNMPLKEVAQVYKYLVIGDMTRAEEGYKNATKSVYNDMPHLRFTCYIPVNIYLNTQRYGRARLALLDIFEEWDNDYIIDFFWARLALLEHDWNKALEHYQRLLANLRRYNAFGRLAFEMQFAHELSRKDLLYLTEGVEPYQAEHKKPIAKIVPKKDEAFSSISMIGVSEKIVSVKAAIEQYADLEETVYIHGETGTGKELVARALHEKSSRKKEPFLVLNCGAITETLLESELFGHEAGAFTGAQKSRAGIFEAAGKGSVFLDEFGEISHRLQTALLRVLENQEIRPLGASQAKKIFCRVIVASNKDLKEVVKEKRMREDLYYRVNRFDIGLPALRDRKEDIPMLLHHYLNINSSQEMLMSDKLIEILSDYHWPGNVRELKNEVTRCRVMNKGTRVIEISDFDFTRLQESVQVEGQKKHDKIKSSSEEFLPLNDSKVNEILSAQSKVERRLGYLHQLFQKHKKLTRIQVMQVLNVSQGTASSDLTILTERGVIVQEKPTKSTRSYYFRLKE